MFEEFSDELGIELAEVEVLRVHIEPMLGTKRLSTIRRSHVRALVDDLASELCGSRIRSIVNGLRSLYRWAQDRELAPHDPAALVRLPAMGATPIERVVSPSEFARLLAALEPEDALPYALAGYAMGTSSSDPADTSISHAVAAGATDAWVLVADDNPDLRDYLLRLLRPSWTIIAANDGLQALELARRHRPDLQLALRRRGRRDRGAACRRQRLHRQAVLRSRTDRPRRSAARALATIGAVQSTIGGPAHTPTGPVPVGFTAASARVVRTLRPAC